MEQTGPRDRISHGLNIEYESSSEDDDVDDDYEEEQQMRNELADVPLGELQQVRETVGSKKFDTVLQRKEHGKQRNFKRANKNRPSEISSKKRVSRFRHVVNVPKKEKGRDPRFDDRCGHLNQDLFEKSYGFLEKLKQEEKTALEKEARRTKNQHKRDQLRTMLQKMESRESNQKLVKEKKELDREHKKVERELAKKGKRPFFIGSSLRKRITLVEKYKSLQSSGQLRKFLNKKRKRNAARDRKKLPASLAD